MLRRWMFPLLLLVLMGTLASTLSEAEEFGKAFAEANCFLQGYAPLREPEKHLKDPQPIRNRIRLRFKFENSLVCRNWAQAYCNSEILEGERKVGKLKGYYKIKAADGISEHAVYERFVLGADCRVKDSAR